MKQLSKQRDEVARKTRNAIEVTECLIEALENLRSKLLSKEYSPKYAKQTLNTTLKIYKDILPKFDD